MSEDPTDPPRDEISEAETLLTADEGDPSIDEPEVAISLNSSLLKPLQPDEVFLSIIEESRPSDASGSREISVPLVKPDVELAQIFPHGLKSFLKDDSAKASIEFSDVRFDQEF